MRSIVISVTTALMALTLAGCYSRTVEEKQPIVVQPQQPQATVVVPPSGTTVVCPPGYSC